VGVWYFSNFQFGFGLKRAAAQFQELELCIFLLWLLFATGWVAALVVRLLYVRLHARKPEVSTGSLKRDVESGSKDRAAEAQAGAQQEGSWVSADQVLIVLVHTLGTSFTCLAFIAGSVPVVQVRLFGTAQLPAAVCPVLGTGHITP
jgi:hypothetical protein